MRGRSLAGIGVGGGFAVGARGSDATGAAARGRACDVRSCERRHRDRAGIRTAAPAATWVQVVIPRGDAVQRASFGSGWRWPAATPRWPRVVGLERLADRDRAPAGEAGPAILELHTAPHQAPPFARAAAHRGLRDAADRPRLVRAQVVNPEDVERSRRPRDRVAPKRGAFQPAAYPDLEGSDVEYVIVTSNALAPAFQALADWKTRRGVPTVVRTIESIVATTRNGSDVQETIRTFCRRPTPNGRCRGCCLGGDTEIIPARYLSSSFASSGGGADPERSLFRRSRRQLQRRRRSLLGRSAAECGAAGSRPADLLAEVYVARAPVTTPAEVATFVQKVIAYETPADPTYQGNTLFLGEVLFPTNWDTEPGHHHGRRPAVRGHHRAALREHRCGIVRRYEDCASFPGALPLSRAGVVGGSGRRLQPGQSHRSRLPLQHVGGGPEHRQRRCRRAHERQPSERAEHPELHVAGVRLLMSRRALHQQPGRRCRGRGRCLALGVSVAGARVPGRLVRPAAQPRRVAPGRVVRALAAQPDAGSRPSTARTAGRTTSTTSSAIPR